MDRSMHTAHQGLQDEMRRLMREALEELLDEAAAKPEMRGELIDVFAGTMLDSVTAHAVYLVKYEAHQRGLVIPDN